MEKTIKSIKIKNKTSFSKSDIDNALKNLSNKEIEQLKNPDYPDKETWCQLRDFLARRSKASNPFLDREMTAYTPSETLALMEKSSIKEWLNKIDKITIPDSAEIICFVPCAKTKPWKNAKRGIYKSYNKIIEENSDKIFFVTISEPLGVVPQNYWDDFPQYDNPGLFKDVVQRSGGLFTKDWVENFGKRYKMPWCQEDYDKAINILANKIKVFVENNQKKDRIFLSFVGDDKTLGTHQDMVNRAGVIPKKNQFLKRGAPREEPYNYLKLILFNIKKIQKEEKNKIVNKKKLAL